MHNSSFDASSSVMEGMTICVLFLLRVAFLKISGGGTIIGANPATAGDTRNPAIPPLPPPPPFRKEFLDMGQTERFWRSDMMTILCVTDNKLNKIKQWTAVVYSFCFL